MKWLNIDWDKFLIILLPHSFRTFDIFNYLRVFTKPLKKILKETKVQWEKYYAMVTTTGQVWSLEKHLRKVIEYPYLKIEDYKDATGLFIYYDDGEDKDYKDDKGKTLSEKGNKEQIAKNTDEWHEIRANKDAGLGSEDEPRDLVYLYPMLNNDSDNPADPKNFNDSGKNPKLRQAQSYIRDYDFSITFPETDPKYDGRIYLEDDGIDMTIPKKWVEMMENELKIFLPAGFNNDFRTRVKR